jgi:hypothetical protein
VAAYILSSSVADTISLLLLPLQCSHHILPHQRRGKQGNFDHTFIAGRMHNKSTHSTFKKVLEKFDCSVECCGYENWSAQGNDVWHNHFRLVHRQSHADGYLNVAGIPLDTLPSSNLLHYLTAQEYGEYKQMSYCLAESTRNKTQAEIYFEQYQNLLNYCHRDDVQVIPLYVALLLSARLNSTTRRTAVVPDIRRLKCAEHKAQFLCARDGKKGYKHYVVQVRRDVVVQGEELNKYLTLEQEQAADQQQQQQHNEDTDTEPDNDGDCAK